ncbi:MAG: AAA family ATPase [Candidatus Limnocylindrales bacterium]
MSQPLPAEPSLEIRVLGPLEVLVDGVPLRVDTRKALAIVALLAVEGRPYARDELAAMFWPESADESARGALRRTLSVLRAALGGRWLYVDRATVALDLQGVRLDLAALDEGVGSHELGALTHAAEVARGPFLAGFSLRDSPDFDDWRATRAVSLERTVAEVLERLTATAEAGGDLQGAIAAASRRLDLDPLDEPARRRVMALLALSGDRSGAIKRYRAGVAILERELGVAPLGETTELYEAIRDARHAPSAHAAQPLVARDASAAGRLPLVGRDAELAVLRVCHAAASVDGRLGVLSGEAGIGKTRLAEALVETVAMAGGKTLVARAFPAEGSIAYGPIVELLRAGTALPDAADRLVRLAPAVLREVERLVALPPGVAGPSTSGATARPDDQPAARARLLDAIATALASFVAGPVPGLIVVEDVQWADDATREALLFLAHRLTGRPLLLLLAWRPEDLDDRGDTFAASIERFVDVTPITLGRLARADVEQLATAAADAGLPGYDVAALTDESEGLPLYVVEALATGPAAASDGPPRGVRALLRERLGSVSETAGQLLAAGAVIGRSFDLATVRGASGRSEDETISALEELVRRGLVREVRGGAATAFDFGHARLRDAAYEATSLARRRLLHRRVAELLRAEPAGRDDPGRLAQVAGHERAAGRDAEAADAFREAGMRARAVYANLGAIDHFENALALGHPGVAELQTAIGELRTMQGDYAGAVAALEAAAAVTQDEDLPAIELRLGRVHARRGDSSTAASHLDGALEMLDRLPASRVDARLLGGVLVERSVVAIRGDDLVLAATLAERALAVGTTAGDARATGAAYRLLGLVARARGDLDRARDVLVQSLQIADLDPDPGAAIAASNALALVEAAAGDRDRAIRLLEDALAECRRTGETHLEAAVENNLADQLHAAGRSDEAMDHLKHAVTLFAEVGGRPGELEPEIWKLVSW